jgi:hypothetical protein
MSSIAGRSFLVALLLCAGCTSVRVSEQDECGYEWYREPLLEVAEQFRTVKYTNDIELHCGKGPLACTKACSACSPAWAVVYLPKRVSESSETFNYCVRKNKSSQCCTREGLEAHEKRHLEGYQHEMPADPMLLSLRRK